MLKVLAKEGKVFSEIVYVGKKKKEVFSITADLPAFLTKKSSYNILGFCFLRSETSFFLMSAWAPLQGMASGNVIFAFSNSNFVEGRGSGIFW